MDLSGRWEGEYTLTWPGDNKRKITAEFQQDGTSILGSVTEMETDAICLGKDYFAAFGPMVDLKWSLQFWWMLRRHPGMSVRAYFPAESKISGSIDGKEVSFLRLFEGTDEMAYVFPNGSESIFKGQLSSSLFSGRLSKDGNEIRGHYDPDHESYPGMRVFRFELRRADAPIA